MQIIAWIYISLIAFGLVSMPFFFGEEGEPYSPKGWLIEIVCITPLLWLLINVIKNN